uniref:CYSTM domain-containing protein n=1 Tax=Macrostomum lignano TaxID=282301 RepID=A0A1I8J3M1_9PLAT
MQGLKDQVLEPGWKDQAKSSIAALRSKLVKGNDTDEFGNYNELDEAEEGSGEPRKPTGKTYYTGLCICCNKCPCARCSKRYITSFLCSMGFLISFGIRCNTGVAT